MANKLTRVLLLFIALLGFTNSYGQIPNDSTYNSWWENKGRSIFHGVDHGKYFGTTTGYIQVVVGKDTLVLDFQSSKTILEIIRDTNEIYDNSTKKYSIWTTNGKTVFTYEIYALANIFTIILKGEKYNIGTIDGACDMPIPGLTFNYCHHWNSEYLTLYAEKSLNLTNIDSLMETKNLDFPEARKIAKTITLLPGSTLILLIRR
ncbi:MAG: hypothetical protein WCL00_08595 [Bacteroidota bacterium]